MIKERMSILPVDYLVAANSVLDTLIHSYFLNMFLNMSL